MEERKWDKKRVSLFLVWFPGFLIAVGAFGIWAYTSRSHEPATLNAEIDTSSGIVTTLVSHDVEKREFETVTMTRVSALTSALGLNGDVDVVLPLSGARCAEIASQLGVVCDGNLISGALTGVRFSGDGIRQSGLVSSRSVGIRRLSVSRPESASGGSDLIELSFNDELDSSDIRQRLEIEFTPNLGGEIELVLNASIAVVPYEAPGARVAPPVVIRHRDDAQRTEFLLGDESDTSVKSAWVAEVSGPATEVTLQSQVMDLALTGASGTIDIGESRFQLIETDTLDLEFENKTELVIDDGNVDVGHVEPPKASEAIRENSSLLPRWIDSNQIAAGALGAAFTIWIALTSAVLRILRIV